MTVEKIISGGQTGVDRAALDVAIELGIPHGGFVPLGRMAEDGVVPARYQLVEMQTRDYPARTRANVEAADATLLLVCGIIGYGSRGSQLVVSLTEKLNKPLIALDLCRKPDAEEVRRWLIMLNVRTLNVAGNRESGAVGIGEKAKAFLREVLAS